MTQAQRPLRVLMLTPRTYWVGRRNSDIRQYSLVKDLLESRYRVELVPCDSWLVMLQANVTYALAVALWRTRLPASSGLWAKIWHHLRRAIWLPNSVVRRARADIIYSIYLFPINRQEIPIALEVDFNPWGIPAMRRLVDRLRYNPRWIVERSSVLLVRHELSREALQTTFPDQLAKAVIVPPPLPGCEAMPEEKVLEKFATFGKPSVKVLFVGNQPVTKGLPELVLAYQRLKERYPIELTVVTRFTEGTVDVPPEVRVLSDLPQQEVYRLMGESHIFAMPTKRDSHGRVFWEAMANGCALVSPCFSPHSELFGEFGASADPTSATDVARALEELIARPAVCQQRALQGRKAFLERYHHSVAARAYHQAFMQAFACSPTRERQHETQPSQ